MRPRWTVVIWTLGAVYFRSEDPGGLWFLVRDFAEELGNRVVGWYGYS